MSKDPAFWAFVERLKSGCKKGVSQKKISERLGVDESLVSRWCNGRHLPTARHVAELARLLREPLGDFAGLYVLAQEGFWREREIQDSGQSVTAVEPDSR